jgi:D-beta-D-heptose 7-phosphate kinase/D-beta-D-heptose 1-phosphate adenosyltransferase
MVGLRDMKRVMVNGTFDIVHRGHIEMLNYAKSQGDYLLVAIDTDRRVKELKGDKRPINNQSDRLFMLENLQAVDGVRFFDSKEDLISIMEQYKPDVYVKGSDWKHDKGSTAEQYCKQVIYYDRVEPYSTTKTIQDITDR